MDVIYPYKIISALLQYNFLDAEKISFLNVQFAIQEIFLFSQELSSKILPLNNLLLYGIKVSV